MSLRNVAGNAAIREALRRAVATDRLAHALLFTGPQGVGKRTLAMELARALVCAKPVDGDGCDACDHCRRAVAGEHLDVRVFEPDGPLIKIAQMRELAREASYRPLEARRRVFIIDPAHQMRAEAANAALKTLEEPAPASHIVLITDQPYALLATVRSRCQIYRFATLSTAEVEMFLNEQGGRLPGEAALLARLGGGRIGRSLAIDLSVYKERRAEMLALVEVMLAPVPDRVRLLKAAEYLAEVGRKARTEFDERLDVLVGLYRDVYWLVVVGDDTGVVNEDVLERLRSISRNTTTEAIVGRVQALNTLRDQLRQNVSRQLALEGVLLGTTTAAPA